MGGKTLTRADLAEAVVQRVGLPRNEIPGARRTYFKRDFDHAGGGRCRQALLVRLVRHPQEGPARRAQSEDRGGGADHAAAGSGVPPEQHHEGSHQRWICYGAEPPNRPLAIRSFQRGLILPKAAEAFRNIGEVSKELAVKKHVLRFWEPKFPQVRPMKRGGGRRLYRPTDVELLRGIRDLLQNAGYTIKGVQKILREQGIEHGEADRRHGCRAHRGSRAGGGGVGRQTPAAFPLTSAHAAKNSGRTRRLRGDLAHRRGPPRERPAREARRLPQLAGKAPP